MECRADNTLKIQQQSCRRFKQSAGIFFGVKRVFGRGGKSAINYKLNVVNFDARKVDRFCENQQLNEIKIVNSKSENNRILKTDGTIGS